MAIRSIVINIAGNMPLLMNNPQTVDPFNRFAKAKKVITKKGIGKTDDDLIELGNLETEGKLYFDDDLKVYVPTRWLTEAIITGAYGVVKIGRDKMRGGMFAVTDKCKLNYENMNKVNTITDVVMNPLFRHRMILPQAQVRVAKDFPIFHKWNFTAELEYDDAVIDIKSLKAVVEKVSRYGGFGDFRPTFGRATATVTAV